MGISLTQDFHFTLHTFDWDIRVDIMKQLTSVLEWMTVSLDDETYYVGGVSLVKEPFFFVIEYYYHLCKYILMQSSFKLLFEGNLEAFFSYTDLAMKISLEFEETDTVNFVNLRTKILLNFGTYYYLKGKYKISLMIYYRI